MLSGLSGCPGVSGRPSAYWELTNEVQFLNSNSLLAPTSDIPPTDPGQSIRPDFLSKKMVRSNRKRPPEGIL